MGSNCCESWAISPTYAVATLTSSSLIGLSGYHRTMQMQMDFSVPPHFDPQLLDFCCCTTQVLQPSPLFECLVSGVYQCPHIIASIILEGASHPTSQL